MVTNYVVKRVKNWSIPPSFFAVALHNEFQYRYVDERINSGDDTSTLFKIRKTLV